MNGFIVKIKVFTDLKYVHEQSTYVYFNNIRKHINIFNNIMNCNVKLKEKLGTVWIPMCQFNHWKMISGTESCKTLFIYFFMKKFRKTTKMR